MPKITHTKTRGERRASVSGRFNPELVAKIDAEMVIDGRPSRSNMIETLCREAIDARTQRRQTESGG